MQDPKDRAPIHIDPTHISLITIGKGLKKGVNTQIKLCAVLLVLACMLFSIATLTLHMKNHQMKVEIAESQEPSFIDYLVKERNWVTDSLLKFMLRLIRFDVEETVRTFTEAGSSYSYLPLEDLYRVYMKFKHSLLFADWHNPFPRILAERFIEHTTDDSVLAALEQFMSESVKFLDIEGQRTAALRISPVYTGYLIDRASEYIASGSSQEPRNDFSTFIEKYFKETIPLDNEVIKSRVSTMDTPLHVSSLLSLVQLQQHLGRSGGIHVEIAATLESELIQALDSITASVFDDLVELENIIAMMDAYPVETSISPAMIREQIFIMRTSHEISVGTDETLTRLEQLIGEYPFIEQTPRSTLLRNLEERRLAVFKQRLENEPFNLSDPESFALTLLESFNPDWVLEPMYVDDKFIVNLFAGNPQRALATLAFGIASEVAPAVQAYRIISSQLAQKKLVSVLLDSGEWALATRFLQGFMGLEPTYLDRQVISDIAKQRYASLLNTFQRHVQEGDSASIYAMAALLIELHLVSNGEFIDNEKTMIESILSPLFITAIVNDNASILNTHVHILQRIGIPINRVAVSTLNALRGNEAYDKAVAMLAEYTGQSILMTYESVVLE